MCLVGILKKTFHPEKIYYNVIDNVVEGSILVFHNNNKSLNNLKFTLEITLNKLKEKGFVFYYLVAIQK